MVGEHCPNCGGLTNASDSRLVRDACGHTKCRMCLVYEEQGCKACQNKPHIQKLGTFDYPGRGAKLADDLDLVTNKVHDEIQIISNETRTEVTRLSVTGQESSNSGSSMCAEDDFQLFGSQRENAVEKIEMNGTNNVPTSSRMESSITDSSPMGQDSLQCHVCPDAGSQLHEEFNIALNQDPFAQKSVTVASRTDIPRIEPLELVSNIRSQLEGANGPWESNNSQIVSEELVPTVYLDNETGDKERSSKDNAQKSKIKKNPPPDRSHITLVPGPPEKYKCTVCCKMFKSKAAQSYHDACVTGIRPYQCPICDRSFVKQSHFEYHERMHSGYKPFKCTFCGKAFPQRNKLNRHMYSHKEEKRFKCSVCGKGYSKRDDLKSHLNTHTGVTPYSCKVCKKSFREATNLTRHMHTHSNERPHMCEQCGKNFKDKSLLVRHRRTHGKDRPFSCSECTRVFLSKSELSRHLAVHSDEKPFTCAFCNTVFRRKDNLNRHTRHHHLEDREGHKSKSQEINSEKSPKPAKSKQTNNMKQRQKPKGKPKTTSITLPKSPAKISVYVNSHEQIKSRLDSTGNITPVIRATGELSNAVPVINGPISIKRPEEKNTTPKKTFTYTEPIPMAEAVVINRRIEEKLYPKTMPSQDGYFRDYRNRIDRQHPVHKLSPLRPTVYNRNAMANRLQIPERPLFETRMSPQRPTVNSKIDNTQSTVTNETIIPEKQIVEMQGSTSSKDTVEIRGANTPRHTVPKKRAIEELKANDSLIIPLKEGTIGSRAFKVEGSNCVPTITKTVLHGTDESDVHTIVKNNSESTTGVPIVKRVEDIANVKKLSDIHWRRRTSEILNHALIE